MWGCWSWITACETGVVIALNEKILSELKDK